VTHISADTHASHDIPMATFDISGSGNTERLVGTISIRRLGMSVTHCLGAFEVLKYVRYFRKSLNFKFNFMLEIKSGGQYPEEDMK